MQGGFRCDDVARERMLLLLTHCRCCFHGERQGAEAALSFMSPGRCRAVATPMLLQLLLRATSHATGRLLLLLVAIADCAAAPAGSCQQAAARISPAAAALFACWAAPDPALPRPACTLLLLLIWPLVTAVPRQGCQSPRSCFQTVMLFRLPVPAHAWPHVRCAGAC